MLTNAFIVTNNKRWQTFIASMEKRNCHAVCVTVGWTRSSLWCHVWVCVPADKCQYLHGFCSVDAEFTADDNLEKYQSLPTRQLQSEGQNCQSAHIIVIEQRTSKFRDRSCDNLYCKLLCV